MRVEIGKKTTSQILQPESLHKMSLRKRTSSILSLAESLIGPSNEGSRNLSKSELEKDSQTQSFRGNLEEHLSDENRTDKEADCQHDSFYKLFGKKTKH